MPRLLPGAFSFMATPLTPSVEAPRAAARMLWRRLADRVLTPLCRGVIDVVSSGLQRVRGAVARMRVPEAITTGEAVPMLPEPRGTAPPYAPPRATAHAGEPTAAMLARERTLPDAYGDERLVLVARDPHCLFAYWELADERRQAARARAHGAAAREVLRLYDVTRLDFDGGLPQRYQDFEAGSGRVLYAYVGRPASCFIAELGIVGTDGSFVPLLRSAPVWTPRADEPGDEPVHRMTVRWDEGRAQVLDRSEWEAAGDEVAAGRPDPSRTAARSEASSPGEREQDGSWSLPASDAPRAGARRAPSSFGDAGSSPAGDPPRRGR